MRLRGLRADQWRGRFAWIISALLMMASLAFLVGQIVFRQSPDPLNVGMAAFGVALGALLFFPDFPRIMKALRRLAMSSPPRGPSGPLPVATMDVALPSSAGHAAPIVVQIWHPAAADSIASPRAGAAPLPCAEALLNSRLAIGQEPYPILLYAAGGGSLRNDNASTAAELASHGYVIVAIDDVDRGPPPPNAADEDEASRPLHFDFSSAAAFETTLRLGANKVRRQADKALAALDGLETCAGAHWRSAVQFDRVGFFGFSFGGAAAAEAGVIDKRVSAVANLDGWLFGAAALGALDKPYMILLTDIAMPGPRERQSGDPKVRYEARLTDRDLAEEVRLANRRDGYGFLVRGSFHENFSDWVFSRSYFKTWFVTDPDRIKAIRDAYLLAFFDAEIRGRIPPLLRQAPPPYREVEVMHGSRKWIDRIAAAANHSVKTP